MRISQRFSPSRRAARPRHRGRPRARGRESLRRRRPHGGARGPCVVHLLDVALNIRADAGLEDGLQGFDFNAQGICLRAGFARRLGLCLRGRRGFVRRGFFPGAGLGLGLRLGVRHAGGPAAFVLGQRGAVAGARVDIPVLFRRGGVGCFCVGRVPLLLGASGHEANLGRGVSAAFKPAVADRLTAAGTSLRLGVQGLAALVAKHILPSRSGLPRVCTMRAAHRVASAVWAHNNTD
jgi:hypothetical protein